jgi:hypothetical protein
MKFMKPSVNQVFLITADAEWPSISFTTDATGSHTWSWTIAWGSYKQSGSATSAGNTWDGKAAIANYGGTLTVRATSGKETATITVNLKGTNPVSSSVTAYLATKADSDGFDKIIQHETQCTHFSANGDPKKSFDNGYGMCQLTNPAPSFVQVWNWKRNVDAGLKLFAGKRTSAIGYLSQSGRAYSSTQLKYEAVCRWNGGSYHDWDAKNGKWIRKADILCDSKTGNIGWDMTGGKNRGKTEDQLHKRDQGSYGSPPDASASWMYSGVCYADAVLG